MQAEIELSKKGRKLYETNYVVAVMHPVVIIEEFFLMGKLRSNEFV